MAMNRCLCAIAVCLLLASGRVVGQECAQYGTKSVACGASPSEGPQRCCDAKADCVREYCVPAEVSEDTKLPLSISSEKGKVHLRGSDLYVQVDNTQEPVSVVSTMVDNRAASQANTDDITALKSDLEDVHEVQRRTATEIASGFVTVEGNIVDNITDVGDSLDKGITTLSELEETNHNSLAQKLDDLSTQDLTKLKEQIGLVETTLKDKMDKHHEEMKKYVAGVTQCSLRHLQYDEEEEECVCPNDDEVVGKDGDCIKKPGQSKNPAKDCATILYWWPQAKSGVYELKPDGGDQFKAYCDMDYEGGGWTLIESYNIAMRSSYSKKHFNTDYPRSANAPPTSTASNDNKWKDYRLSMKNMKALMDRSTQFHARCHRDSKKSLSDYIVGEIGAVQQAYNGAQSYPYWGSYSRFAMRGKVRGLVIGGGVHGGWAWYHQVSGWHAGFDIGGSTGSVSSEDSFTWHDGGLNAKHKCHTTAGDIVWMVRSIPGPVGTKENPGYSCNHILHESPKSQGQSGPYYLNLAESGVKKVFCEMQFHGGGWTLWMSARLGEQAQYWANDLLVGSGLSGQSIQEPRRVNSAFNNFKLRANDINGIRESWKTWGGDVKDGDISYWTVTPGSGTGLWGAENFHRQDCEYDGVRYSSQIKQTSCRQSKWKYQGQDTWVDGGHWWDNSNCYRSPFGYSNEGNHGTGGRCFSDGRGLGYHCGGYAPFHRGWCGTRSWGIQFVR